jgi:hypothetical protein
VVDRSPLSLDFSPRWGPTTSESLAFSSTRVELELGWVWAIHDTQMGLPRHYWGSDSGVVGIIEFLVP